MLLAEIAAASAAIAATRSRTEKQGLFAEILRRLEPAEIEPAVAFLAGEPRQGRIGVGWAALSSIAPRHAASPTLSVTAVDAALSEIQATSGAGSATRRGILLTSLFERATVEEAGFLARVLGGELRQGALEGIAVDAIAKAAGVPGTDVRRALMLGGELPAVARIALIEGAGGLHRVKLTVGRPVQPMLASAAASATAAIETLGTASVEWKLDGVRIQAHRDGDDVRVFTRNLNDITSRVPDVVGAIRMLPVTTLVADGEAIAFGDNDRPILFQETMSRVGRAAGERGVAMTPFLFDVLHLDGEDLIDRPLSERLSALSAIAGPTRIPGIVTADADEAERFLLSSLEAGHEGVVIKAVDATYQAGRRGKSWLKVKPAPTLDLVVLAAEWGHGRRQGTLSNLHLGARDPSSGELVMVGKTFKGLTDAMLAWQTERLLGLEERRDAYTVHVRPELVVEVALDSAQVSKRYPGGVALRFARVKRYREDKRPQDADTIDAVRGLVPK